MWWIYPFSFMVGIMLLILMSMVIKPLGYFFNEHDKIVTILFILVYILLGSTILCCKLEYEHKQNKEQIKYIVI